jgi:2-amino-4-hydroxy-6-hydroxymethyldihydropteridine diphosphokinase
MARAFIGIGSNIRPEINVKESLLLLQQQVRVLQISTVYVTEPIGRPADSPYYNAVVAIETEHSPLDLKQQVLSRIEVELGRKREPDRYASRTIDLDLLLYDDVVIASDALTLPDPDILARPFLAVPLLELAPELILPGSTKRLADAASGLPRSGMAPLPRYTYQLRKDILHERSK